ncbi:ATPase [Dactylosporangium aurantiacum]|uniref:ATPase n=1 Tax=Dactylosporangium aurantiacum TaxID=35754 RepID=A0A9Q9MKI8_9ACTN|nr:BadF/BadG/BcrA/BcrD ATPase family protein [Dactylosporangium aurantiacum]MDG6104711.1 BadF/BadG/BcrA/BcrD ATPase family protein [Dactylosporangium aurantiacum]UWZ55721.1 ATPase [Dactylosporangium aurantiacum]
MVLILGVDAGGTASKAVVVAPDGTVLGRGTAGPGNPSAVGSAAAVAIGAAVREALGPHDPGGVVAGVVGVAGVSILADPGVAASFAEQWAGLGLTCPVEMAGDAVTAFAAGSAGTRGAALIAGTGAVAALVDGLEVVRTADGLGWLLGDEGSGLWLGLQAVRHAARHWSSSGLAVRVALHAGVTSADDLVHWAQRLPLGSFAALAPVVCEFAAAGDPAAAAIVADAVDRLVATLDALQAPDAAVVLAGGLLTAATPVRDGVLDVLRGRGVEIGTAHDPALGAARLALQRWSSRTVPSS